MRFEAGIFEVLSADQRSVIHGDADSIETTHFKEAWLKNLRDQSTKKVVLTNSTTPRIVGRKIGLAFLNNELIAFKRGGEIPVEDPVQGKALLNTPKAILLAIIYAACLSVPVFGYIGGIVIGGGALISGKNILGRYSKNPFNRLYALFLLIMSIAVWFPVQYIHGDMDRLIDIHMQFATWLMIVTVIFQYVKLRVEKNYFTRACVELNAAWPN